MPDPISITLAAVAIATNLNVFIRRFNMPTVIGYFDTGTMPSAKFHVDLGDDETLQHVATAGGRQAFTSADAEQCTIFRVRRVRSTKKYKPEFRAT
jgi:hypothetical protein